jgi:hypothetical protein
MQKIENWNKLDGQIFNVMGIEFQFEKPEVDDTGRYTIWLNEEITNAPISLMRIDLYIDDMEIDIKTFVPVTFSSPPFHTRKKITKDHLKDPSIFIQTIGSMIMGDSNVRKVLDYLDEMVGNSVKHNVGGASTGLSGNTIKSGSANLW